MLTCMHKHMYNTQSKDLRHHISSTHFVKRGNYSNAYANFLSYNHTNAHIHTLSCTLFLSLSLSHFRYAHTLCPCLSVCLCLSLSLFNILYSPLSLCLLITPAPTHSLIALHARKHTQAHTYTRTHPHTHPHNPIAQTHAPTILHL